MASLCIIFIVMELTRGPPPIHRRNCNLEACHAHAMCEPHLRNTSAQPHMPMQNAITVKVFPTTPLRKILPLETKHSSKTRWRKWNKKRAEPKKLMTPTKRKVGISRAWKFEIWLRRGQKTGDFFDVQEWWRGSYKTWRNLRRRGAAWRSVTQLGREDEIESWSAMGDIWGPIGPCHLKRIPAK